MEQSRLISREYEMEGARRRRNRNFEDTHRILIEKAVELISKSGAEALSISMLARTSGINRSTVYYHFESREVLIEAVKAWSSEQIAIGFKTSGDREENLVRLITFVLANPEVTKMWIDAFISPGDVRERYPMWDELLAWLRKRSGKAFDGEPFDEEVVAAQMITATLIGSRVYANSVRPGQPIEELAKRLARQHLRLVNSNGLTESI